MSVRFKKVALFFLALIIISSVPAAAAESSGTAGSVTDKAADKLNIIPDNVIVYIPFRSLIEQLGGIIDYDAKSGSILAVTPDEKTLSHVPGTKTMLINGITVNFELPSLVKGGFVYLPASSLEIILGNGFKYDNVTNTVSMDNTYTAGGIISKLLKCKELAHYLPRNLFKYMYFIQQKPNIPIDIAAAYVNVGAEKSFFSDIQLIQNPESIQVFCNKNNILPDTYEPDDLVYITGTYYMLRKEAADHYDEMRKAAKQDGLSFTVYSAYRSYSIQKGLYNRYVQQDGTEGADEYSARPGHSEHQAGLAVDLTTYASGEFKNTGEYIWLLLNAYKYGYILRYPEGYSDMTGYMFESWHWRYIGVAAATKMHDEKIATYEEYCGKYLIS